MHLIGDVANRDCIIVDDMIDTGGTLCKAAEALKNVALNAYLRMPPRRLLRSGSKKHCESVIDEVIITDSIPLSDEMKRTG